MSKPNYAGQAVGGVTHIGLTPVQGGITIADAIGTSVHTVLNTGKNLLKTLAYPFSTKTYKPQRNELGGIWKNFSNRQKDHRNKYIAPFKGNPNEAPLLAKITGGITHFATAIPVNTVMTILDGTYSTIKTPFSILKNIGKTVIFPFSNETWKPKFKQDLKDIWGKEKGFAARTRDGWINTFDVIPKKEKRGEGDKSGVAETETENINENTSNSNEKNTKKEESKNEKQKENKPKSEQENREENANKEGENTNVEEKNANKGKESANEGGLKKDSIITRKIIKENPDTIFVFGDNVEAKNADAEAIAQKGDNEEILAKSGGQAKEMRPAIKDGKKDIENSVGIPTMNGFGEHMTDNEFYESKIISYPTD